MTQTNNNNQSLSFTVSDIASWLLKSLLPTVTGILGYFVITLIMTQNAQKDEISRLKEEIYDVKTYQLERVTELAISNKNVAEVIVELKDSNKAMQTIVQELLQSSARMETDIKNIKNKLN